MQLKPEDISKIIKEQIKNYDNTMHGVYAGTVEFGKIPKSQLDWTSKAK